MKRFSGRIKKAGSFQYGPRSTSAVWDERLKAAFESWKNTHKGANPEAVKQSVAKKESEEAARKDMLKRQAAIKKSFATAQKEFTFKSGRMRLAANGAPTVSTGAQAASNSGQPPVAPKLNLHKQEWKDSISENSSPGRVNNLIGKASQSDLARLGLYGAAAGWALRRRKGDESDPFFKKVLGAAALWKAWQAGKKVLGQPPKP